MEIYDHRALLDRVNVQNHLHLTSSRYMYNRPHELCDVPTSRTYELHTSKYPTSTRVSSPVGSENSIISS